MTRLWRRVGAGGVLKWQRAGLNAKRAYSQFTFSSSTCCTAPTRIKPASPSAHHIYPHVRALLHRLPGHPRRTQPAHRSHGHCCHIAIHPRRDREGESPSCHRPARRPHHRLRGEKEKNCSARHKTRSCTCRQEAQGTQGRAKEDTQTSQLLWQAQECRLRKEHLQVVAFTQSLSLAPSSRGA